VADDGQKQKGRGRKKTRAGIVTSNKMVKTIIVKAERLVKHPTYGKYVKKCTKFWVHDENNLARIGDRVLIMETRPLSRKKRWRLVRVLGKTEDARPDAPALEQPAGQTAPGVLP
jgi:small subunit ribosomal protein S17